MSTPTTSLPSVSDAQKNTLNSHEFLALHEVYICFKAVLLASKTGDLGVIVEVLPEFLALCFKALEAKGYLVTELEQNLLQIEWCPATLRRAAFQIISGGLNE